MVSQSRPILVTYDDQAFRLQRRGGVSRAFVELIRAFESGQGSVVPVVPLRYTDNEHLLELDPQRFRHPPLGLRKEPLVRVANRLVARGPRSVDIMHHTFYFGTPPPNRARARFTTVYDMIPELFPGMFGNIRPHAEKFRYLAESDGIICISEVTKSDLEKICPSLAAPTFVVPLGVSPQFTFRTARPHEFPWPYLLHIGQRGFYKDFALVLDAFVELADRYCDLRLVCVGGEPWTENRTRSLSDDIAARIVHIRPSDRDLPAIYQHASAYVSASRYEGFGLPVLEALASRVPAVISDIGSHREVAHDAAVFFEPGRPDQLVEQIHRVLRGGDDERRRLTNAGAARAEAFTWKRVAERTEQAYRSVL